MALISGLPAPFSPNSNGFTGFGGKGEVWSATTGRSV
jgi:hypothetical protein